MSDLKKIKGNLKVEGDLSLPSESPSKALTIDSSGNVKSSDVTTTELSQLSGVTSPVQDQLNDLSQDISDVADDLSDLSGTVSDLSSDISDVADDLADHINSGTAHAASSIVVTPAGNLAADDVQEALQELQSDVDSRIPSTQKGAANGVATLDATGKVPVSQLPNAIMEYQGTWDADQNLPQLENGAGNADSDIGNIYRVTVAGTVDFGAGNISFEVGDYAILNVSKIWEKAETTEGVLSFNGRAGHVDPEAGDYTASDITNVPSGNLAATDVQAALDELQSDVDSRALSSDLSDHISDSEGAHAASAISFTSGGDLISDNAQGAIDELEVLIDDHIADSADAHMASAIGVTPAGNLSSATVQLALEELQSDIDSLAVSSSGDIFETSFNIANDQASPANVTGFLFDPLAVRSFSALVSVEIDADSDLFEQFTLEGINKGSSFNMAVSSVGDDSGVVFSITSAGQVRYTSQDKTGFDSGKIKFRAISTSVN
jgi:hypothetical protein